MRKNVYKIWSEESQADFDKLPIKWAFTDEKFKEIMQEWGLSENDTDKICNIGYGGIMRKSDLALLTEHTKKFDLENKKQDKRFFVDMLLYELNNHEYGYTRDLEDTLFACQISAKDLQDEKIVEWINEALQIWKYLNGYDEYSD